MVKLYSSGPQNNLQCRPLGSSKGTKLTNTLLDHNGHDIKTIKSRLRVVQVFDTNGGKNGK
jgi:hypothetical protein